MIVGLASFVLGPAACAQSAPEDLRYFETHIRPLLAERCLKCHGPTKQKGGLRLDSADAVKKGGDSGEPLFSPEKSDGGLLLRAVRHAADVEAMPPEGKLKDAEIAALETWVKSGASFPPTAKVGEPAPVKHWAFQPVVRPGVPVNAADNPIDSFL